ncbi:geobacillin-26 family protein [Virgibacillus flavescens]|uniref:geobacillin-26 family protein n=1 Tax=Virgibacillus flavescens TaxID=1611422 RepID=UPI003D34BEDD
MLKKLLGVLLAVVVFGATVLPAISYGETVKEGINIVKDNDIERIAVSLEDGEEIEATLDKDSNILTIEEDGEERVFDLDALAEEYVESGSISPDVSSSQTDFGIMAATTKQNTFINYEYTITHGSPERWQLRRPDGKSLIKYKYQNVTRTTSNKSQLTRYQGYVENINYYEIRAIGTSLTTLGLSFLAFILSVPTAGAGTLTAGLAALGAYGATLDAAVKLGQNANWARATYFDILY